MKNLLLLFFISIVLNASSSQVYLNSGKFYSPNQKYYVEIRGYFYSNFYGNCQYIFYDSTNKKLWDKKLTYGGIPDVSNSGDVAIPTNGSTLMIDANGNIFFEVKTGYNEKGYKHHLSGGCDPAWHISPHGFSANGDYYFLTAGNKTSQKTILYCLSKYGKELWKKEFENFCPHNVNSNDKLVLIDNFSGAGISRTNELFVLNINTGEIIKEFDLKIKSPQIKHLIIENDGFIYYNTEITKYDNHSEIIRVLTNSEIRDLIIDSNEKDKIMLGLSYLNRSGETNILKNDSKKLCEMVFNANDPYLKRIITISIESLNMTCF